MAAQWRAAQDSPPSRDAFEQELIQQWQAIGCAASGAPYVLTLLSRRVEPEISDQARRTQLAKAFLDPSCAGARGISDETRAKLIELSRKPSPGSASTASPP